MLDESVPLAEAALLATSLELAQLRLQLAVDRKGRALPWPPHLAVAEATLDDRSDAALSMSWLRDRLALNATELCVLRVLVAHELCPTSRGLLRALNTEALADPTTEALRQAVYGPTLGHVAWRELAACGRLRRYRLIERTDGDAHAPEHRQTWRVASRVLALSHGDRGLDAELASFAKVSTERATGIRDLGLEAAPADVAAIDVGVDAALASGAGWLVVYGRSGTGRRSLLLAALHARGLTPIVADVAALAKDVEVAKRQLSVLARECRLLAAIPVLRNLDALAGSADSHERISLVEGELGDCSVLATATRRIARRWQRAPRTVELSPFGGAQYASLWAAACPTINRDDADRLATMYPIAPALIDSASRVALEQAAGESLTSDHIMVGLRTVLDDRLAGLASRVTVSQTWDDVVLPADQAGSIAELIARIRERRVVYEDWGFAAKVGRGLGVSALFSGPPGTGKTMTAGLIARDLDTELYQVDLSKIVSKWIGETEKNLASLFDAAEAGHAILLFDEADTLFGKRTDVKSSNDRNANQETNYLLQRLETFTGVCILTTNHETAIDEAFRRRLSAHVQFAMPEVEERSMLWRTLLPSAAPIDGHIDFARLALDYEMSGGYIKNAVLRAAFMAADARTGISAAHLSRGAQLEYQAMGRIMSSFH